MVAEFDDDGGTPLFVVADGWPNANTHRGCDVLLDYLRSDSHSAVYVRGDTKHSARVPVLAKNFYPFKDQTGTILHPTYANVLQKTVASVRVRDLSRGTRVLAHSLVGNRSKPVTWTLKGYSGTIFGQMRRQDISRIYPG